MHLLEYGRVQARLVVHVVDDQRHRLKSVSRRWNVNAGNTAATQYHGVYLDPADFAHTVNNVVMRGTDTAFTQRWRLLLDTSNQLRARRLGQVRPSRPRPP
jgi:hypothetical protein